MTVKPMDVHPFALVQPEVALTANLQDKSEQTDNSIVLSQEKPLYDQLLVSEHHTKRCNEQQSYMSGQYLLIAQGTKTYPAVVDVWPYVYFYTHKKEDLWISASIRHSIKSSEVVKPIDPPDVCLIGTRRFMYKFKDL
ncbi:uncharacterized protein LOC143047091 [Mytilus galloprovincialis]|uniref:uncharacterized protein LOC143047091 n=1 Tax=Mytilus galloprovincialis TaxID=29158 RepID=UPI003F7C1403